MEINSEDTIISATGSKDIGDISERGVTGNSEVSPVSSGVTNEGDKNKAQLNRMWSDILKILPWVVAAVVALIGTMVSIYIWNATRTYDDIIIPVTENKKTLELLEGRVSELESQDESTLNQILQLLSEYLRCNTFEK